MHGNMGPQNPSDEPRQADGIMDERTTMGEGAEPGGSDMSVPAEDFPESGRKGGEVKLPGGGILSGGDDEDSASVGDLYGDAAVFGTDAAGKPSER